MLNMSVSDNLTFTVSNTDDNQAKAFSTTGTDTFEAVSCWDYYHRYWYPETIIKEYPVYLQERSKDKGKQAFEIIKVLKDKRFVNLEKVGDFIDLMDELIKIL